MTANATYTLSCDDCTNTFTPPADARSVLRTREHAARSGWRYSWVYRTRQRIDRCPGCVARAEQ